MGAISGPRIAKVIGEGNEGCTGRPARADVLAAGTKSAACHRMRRYQEMGEPGELVGIVEQLGDLLEGIPPVRRRP